MNRWLLVCTMLFALACSGARAQQVTTPILTLNDDSSGALPFHLVSQTATRTEVEFDGLAALMNHSLYVAPGNPSLALDVQHQQSFHLSLRPEFELWSVGVRVDGFVYSVGTGFSGSSAQYVMSLLFQGASTAAEQMITSGSGMVEGYRYPRIGIGEPLGTELELGIDLSAQLRATAAPWLQGEAVVGTQRVALILDTRQIAPIPEPAGAALYSAGAALVLGMLCQRRRRPVRETNKDQS